MTLLGSILNSLWQAALVATVIWLALKFLPRMKVTVNAATRHAIWWAALGIVIVLPAAPGIKEAFRSPEARVQGKPAREAAALHTQVTANLDSPALVTVPQRRSSAWPLWVFGIWGALCLYRTGQIVRSYLYLCRVKRRSSISPLALPAIRRPARLLLSPDVASPMAVGFLRPAVILPESLPDELDPSELDHVLLHESAHLSRYDDWTNLFVRLVGAVLAIHPVVLWILRQIEREREMACDDWVVARTGAPRPYAASLARMSELRWTRGQGSHGLKLAAGFLGSGLGTGERIEAVEIRMIGHVEEHHEN